MRLSPRLHRSFIETRPKSASREPNFVYGIDDETRPNCLFVEPDALVREVFSDHLTTHDDAVFGLIA